MCCLNELESNGFCILPQVANAERVAAFNREVDRVLQIEDPAILSSRGTAYGARNVLKLWPGVVQVAELPAVVSVVRQVLGAHAGLVRVLLFDKPPERSWTLPWHRDRTIAVQDLPEQLGEFSNPTRKAEVAHLIAPNWLLENMLTLRLSLDPMTPENGPLVVLPGSHRRVGQSDEDLEPPQLSAIHTVHCQAGDVFVMRPLLAHSSLLSQAHTKLRRRVLHLEFCNQPNLPSGLCWHDFLPLENARCTG